MKKNTIIAAIAAASAILLCASCQKQELIEQNNGINATGKVFTATIGQGLTKTTITSDFKVNWLLNDEVSINEVKYTATPDANDPTKAALATTEAAPGKLDGKYKALYPYSLIVPAEGQNPAYFAFPAKQTYAEGQFNAPMYAESETEVFTFNNICGALCLSLKGTDKVKSISVTANEAICGAFTMTDATTVNLTGDGKTVTLDCGEGVQLNATTATNFYIYLPPKDSYTAGMKIVATSTEGKTFEKTTAKAVKIEKNNLYTFDWEATFSEPAADSYVEIAAKYDGSTVSTLRWYKQNLAITDSGKRAWNGGSGSAVKVPGTDEDVIVGDYFQWGTFTGFYGNGIGTDKGLLPYTSFTSIGCGDGSDDITFKDGKQFNQTNAPYWSGSTYTKYNDTDRKTTLDASDDAASIILGDTWRMPTADEFQAMTAATYWKWDETDTGYYVYTPNPASDAGKVNDGTGTYDKADALLFFPTAGNGYEDTYYDVKYIADYWYGSLNSASVGSACHLFFNSSGDFNANSRDSQRFRGFSVRPVQDPAATYVAVTNVSLDVTSKEISVGGNFQLSTTVTPSDATQQGVYWMSSDETVATVDAYGNVKGVSEGIANITATTVDGSKTATCNVTVTISTIADVLATVDGGFPVSTAQNIVPDNAWHSGTNHFAYVYSTALFIKQPTDEDGSKAGQAYILLDKPVTKVGNSYTYSHTIFNLTFKMKDGILTSIEISGSSATANTKYDGTYTAPGVFSVSASKKVHFSQGNLIATIDASGTPTAWRFAANQYDYLGEGGANKTIGTAAGDVDLFGWSTSNNGGTSTTDNYGIKTSTSGDDYLGEFYDWGKAIGDGNTWRTLTIAEWQYLINVNGNENIRKGKYKYGVTVCGKANCLVLAPDDFAGTIESSYDTAAWASAEAAGLVCLPAAGHRYGSSTIYTADHGRYWSSSVRDVKFPYYVDFYDNRVSHDSSSWGYYGCSVRLVTDVPAK